MSCHLKTTSHKVSLNITLSSQPQFTGGKALVPAGGGSGTQDTRHDRTADEGTGTRGGDITRAGVTGA